MLKLDYTVRLATWKSQRIEGRPRRRSGTVDNAARFEYRVRRTLSVTPTDEIRPRGEDRGEHPCFMAQSADEDAHELNSADGSWCGRRRTAPDCEAHATSEIYDHREAREGEQAIG